MVSLNRFLINNAQSRRRSAYYSGWSWATHPTVTERINSAISGDPAIGPYDYVQTKYGSTINNVLDLGCGQGAVLKEFIQRGVGRSYCGIDISQKAINAAREVLPGDQCQLRVADLNKFRISGNFDLIYCWYSLHHVQNLEHLLSEVARALSPNGIFLVYDYFGPTCLQWSASHLNFAEAFLNLLPPDLRRYQANSLQKLVYYLISRQVTYNKGAFVRTAVTRQPVWLVRLRDPSEAVRSSDMYDALRNAFVVVENHVTPGSIAQLTMDNIVQNLLDPAGCSYVTGLLDFEDFAVRNGLLPALHRFLVLKAA